MSYSLPLFYAGLLRVKTVDSVIGGDAMKDFLQGAAVIVTLLALFMGVRIALFVPLHNEMIGVKDPAPIAAADGGCGVMQVKMPCFRHAKLETASVPRQSGSAGSAGAETVTARDTRCAEQQVKFPCLQHTDSRS
jgi:hypothetical protein